MKDRSSRRPGRVLTLLLVFCLLAAACGSRRTTEEIAGAAGSDASINTDNSAADVTSKVGDIGAGSDPNPAASNGAEKSNAEEPRSASAAPNVGGDQQATADERSPVASRAPIRIGNVGTYSGPAGADPSKMPPVLRAWADRINNLGGVNGHPIDLVIADDGGDPARSLSLVRDMVENKNVVAFVSNMVALTSGGSRAYLEEKEIPVVGGDLVAADWASSPMLFPQGTTPPDFAYGQARVIADLGVDAAGVLYCAEVQACKAITDQIKQHLVELGVDVVYEAQISIAQPDFTAECLRAEQEGAQAIAFGSDTNSLLRMATSCARQNYRPRYQLGGISVRNDLADKEDLDGLVSAQNVFPWFATSGSAAIEEYSATMSEYSIEPSAAGAMAWVSAKLFEKVVTMIGDGEVTSSALVQSLRSLDGETLGGLAPPLQYDSAPYRIPCGFQVGLIDGSFVTLQKGRPVCP